MWRMVPPAPPGRTRTPNLWIKRDRPPSSPGFHWIFRGSYGAGSDPHVAEDNATEGRIRHLVGRQAPNLRVGVLIWFEDVLLDATGPALQIGQVTDWSLPASDPTYESDLSRRMRWSLSDAELPPPNPQTQVWDRAVELSCGLSLKHPGNIRVALLRRAF